MGRDATPSVGIDRILSLASFTLPYFRAQSAWMDHGPFALWLMPAVRPRTFVELGTHGGYSYFAFCQAVKEHGLGAKCYAVDTWAGDAHAGFYGEEFYNRVFDYNEAHYADFSRLVRSTFQDALKHFSDGSIDLLHIDGRHFFEDVTEDFESWRPKLSDRAVVVFHDVNVRERDFGVFRLWESLRDKYPSFEFHHGHGLGILGYGPNIPAALRQWLSDMKDPATADFVRTAYSRLGGTLKAEMTARDRLDELHVHAKALAADRDRLNALLGETNTAYQQAAAAAAGAFQDEAAKLRQALAEETGRLQDDIRAEAARHQATLARAEGLERQISELIAQREMLDLRRDEYQNALHHMTLDRNAQAAALADQIAYITAVTRSTSWRLTRPLRVFKRGPKWLASALFQRFRPVLRKLYHTTPMPLFVKRWIVALVFGVEETAVDEVAPPIERDYSLAMPFGYAGDIGTPKVAAICHIFHPQVTAEIQRYLQNIPTAFDTFVSTDTPEKKAIIESFFAGWTRGKVEVRVTPNRGRDIAPKLLGFRDVYPNYEYFLHLHSKISKHAGVLEYWRGVTFENLLGSRAVVESIFTAFAQRPDLGAVGAQHFEQVRHWLNWGNNFGQTNMLAKRMGFTLSPKSLLDFPSGSMFWGRTAALKPLLDLNLAPEDFPPEAGQLDGTLAHAIERIYFLVAEKAGFRWLKVGQPELFAESPMVRVETPADLDRFIAEHGVQLLGPNPPKPRKKQPQQIMPTSAIIPHLQEKALGSDLALDTSRHVAVGIITYNTPSDELTRVVRSARKALAHAGFELRARIYILDNGAPSAITGDAVVRLPPVGNVGFGAGHNALMREAFARGADVYIAANPDGAFHPDAIGALMRMMQAQSFHALIEALQFPLEHQKVYDPVSLETPWTSGACLAVPRGLYETMGGFDEAFFMYCEDVDFAWRARAHGFLLRTCPTAYFLHAVTNRPRNLKTLEMIHASTILLARKWGSPTFEEWVRHEMRELNFPVPDTQPAPVCEAWRQFADFANCYTFAQARW